MRWLADECVSASLVKSLRAEGQDVAYVAEMSAGLSDLDVIALAMTDSRLLLTEDKDFGELTVRFGRRVPGLVLIRIDAGDSALKSARLADAIERYGADLFGRHVVIDEGRMRARVLLRDD